MIVPREYTPHPYQERAIQDVIDDDFHALFMEPGLGKTSVIFEAYRRLREDMDVDKMLIIAPMRVMHLTWPDELEKWKQFNDLKISILHGPKKQEALERDADIYMINPEGLAWLIGQPIVKKSKAGKKRTVWRWGQWPNWKGRPEMLVVDELTRFKRSSGVRARTLKKVLGDFGRRIGMTGTPAPNGLMDLHGQMLVIDRGEALDPRVTYFQKEFFDKVQVGLSAHAYRWDIRRGSRERIYELIRPRITRLDAKDYLELPKRVTTSIMIEIPKAARRVYDEMKQHGATILDDGTDVLAVEESPLGKLRQIASGNLYTNPPNSNSREWRLLHLAKVTALDELLDEIGKPCIVAYEFKHDLEVIRRELAERDTNRVIEVLGGETSVEDARRIKDAWNEGRVDVLLIHPKSGGIGLNLQDGGNCLIWYTPPWDLEEFEQTVGRIERQGQKEPKVWVYFMVASNSIDGRVVMVLGIKGATQTHMMDALKEEFE